MEAMTTEKSKSKLIYETLRKVKVLDEHIDKKSKFSYISWSVSLDYLYQHFPEAEVKTHLDHEGKPWHDYGKKGSMVHVSVTILGVKRELWHPIMDNRNNPKLDVNVRDVNDSLMRAYSKCISKHGLGLYIYQGEDTPQLTPKDLLEELEIFINNHFEKSEAQEKLKKVTDGLKKYKGNEANELTFLKECFKKIRQQLS